MPDLLIKDSARRVLARIPYRGPNQANADASPFPPVEPEMVDSVEVLRDSSLAPVPRHETANGLVIIILSPAGTRAWRKKASVKSHRRAIGNITGGLRAGALLGALSGSALADWHAQ
jgi:hypothetical protein